MAYPPEFLPARSWNRVLGSLQDHFGDSAQLDAATQQRIHDYLVANAADKAQNEHSFAIMHSLNASEAPLRITATPYIAGIHAAVLDPVWGGNPRPKTLTECSVCHLQAAGRQLHDAEIHGHRRSFSRARRIMSLVCSGSISTHGVAGGVTQA